MSNAIKFTDHGFVRLEVSLVQYIQTSRELVIRFAIADSGIGIPEDKQTLIYERFSKLTPSNQEQYKGLGTGLFMVKQMVSELNGELNLESCIGQGSTFTLLLPCKLPLSDHYCYHRMTSESETSTP
jgi:signal transduction histidine kinase